MKKEKFISDVKEAIDIALFKDKAMHKIAGDKNATKCAMMVLVIAAIISAVGIQIFSPFAPSLAMSIGTIIYQVVLSIISIYILSVIAVKIFKGTAKHDAFFRVLAFGFIITWLNIFPAIGFITALWSIALVFVILKKIHKLTTGGAIGTLLVGIVVLAIISAIVGSVFGRFGIGTYNNGSFNSDFKMNFDIKDDTGAMELDDGVMKITGPDGEVMEIEIPDFE